MDKCKVVWVDSDSIVFNNGLTLSSSHYQDCCENHYLCMADLALSDFDGLEFDLSGEDFFERVPGYGIALKPIIGHPVRIPGYGSNNGFYSANLDLVLYGPNFSRSFDIEECQVING